MRKREQGIQTLEREREREGSKKQGWFVYENMYYNTGSIGLIWSRNW